MRGRCFGFVSAVGVAVVFASLAAITVAAQAPASTTSTPASDWTPSKTPDGQPDLQGVWANNSVTPLERPRQWAGKLLLNDKEMAELKELANEIVENDGDAQFGDDLIQAALDKKLNPISYDPTTGNYNQFWLVDREWEDRRTALITDPADGRVPALTPEGQKRLDAELEYKKLHPADGPEDRGQSERCVNFGVPKLGAGYNSYYQVFQTPTHVVILSEMAHDPRIIPLDGRAHLDSTVRQWNGDPRGHWEGNTLVVETTNFSPKSTFASRGAKGIAHENLHLVERFTRVGPTTLNYEVTITDPTVWSRPWTVLIPLKQKDEAIYEYACHEGNIGMFGILGGFRAQEKAAKTKGSFQQ